MNDKVNNIKYEGMESLVTAVIVCDKDLIINYINPSTETLFEVSLNKPLITISVYFLKIPIIFSKRYSKKLVNKKIATKNMSTFFKRIRKKQSASA